MYHANNAQGRKTQWPRFVVGWVAALLITSLTAQVVCAAQAPRFVQMDGRHALLVDGKPFLMLGGQIHNSSAWPSELPQVWESAAALHANTLLAPIYWQQFEPKPGQFDTTIVDALVQGARARDLRLVLIWFGTWKNGKMYYVPSWVKADTQRFARVIRPDGEPLDVLSPLGRNTLQADKAAFVALMDHLKKIDGDKHTVLMVQIENEAGTFGSVRDNSPEANQLFKAAVPAEVLAATRKKAGTWKEVFGDEADEIFQVYHQAKYINEIAVAGKAAFDIPCMINVWITNPIEQRKPQLPGVDYPSGGAVHKRIDLWKALTPAIDVIAPDIYDKDPRVVESLMQTYLRADNPLLIPEIGRSDNFAKFFYTALDRGVVGFAPFGIDRTGWNIVGDEKWTAHARNFLLFHPMSSEIAHLEFDGKVKTAVEEAGRTSKEIEFGEWQATVTFPQRDRTAASGGAALVAQLGPDEFLVTGADASVAFHLKDRKPGMHSQFVTVEQGYFENGAWKPLRLWNGDEGGEGFSFHQEPEVVRVKMQKF